MEAVRLSCVLHSEYDTAIHQRDEARARVAELEADQSPACAARWKEVREERDSLRAALSAAEVARDAYATELAEARAEVERLTRLAEEAGVQLAQLTRSNAELVLLALGPQESNPGPDAPSQERATGAVGSAPDSESSTRWGLWQDGILLRTFATCEEAEAVQRSGQGVGVVSWAKGQFDSAPTTDNAALRQRVFEHIGNLILNEKAGWGWLPDLVAQFDLLGRDLS